MVSEGPNPNVLVTYDMRTWRAAGLDGVTGLSYGPLAGFGESAYVLGHNAAATSVWRTSDGNAWRKTELPGAMAKDPNLAIAAGPQGVVVIGYDRATTGGSSTAEGLRVWYSPDGKEFSRTTLIREKVVQGGEIRLTAVHDGFLLHGIPRPVSSSPLVLWSTNGSDWQDIGSGLPTMMPDAIGRTGQTTVALSTWFDKDEESPGLTAWFRRDGDTQWTTGAIDLGKLPDKGVAPRGRQRVSAVHSWNGGFIGLGGTEGKDRFGAVWTSSDGASWTRTPLGPNGFDRVSVIFAAVSQGQNVTLLGMDQSIDGPKLTSWHSSG